TDTQPEIDESEDRFTNFGVVVIQIRLMAVETMPVVGFSQRVPRPIRSFKVFENYSSILIFFWIVAPYVIVSVVAARFCSPSPFKPNMLIGSMIYNKFGDYIQSSTMGLF